MAKTNIIEKNLHKVLIAEDNAKTRLFLKNQLELLGYSVVGAASNGKDVVEMAVELKPTLVIMDVKMPQMDGIEAARAITAKTVVPIILITGISSDDMALKAIDAGVFAYLVKPVTKKQLEPAIRLALARYEEFKSLKSEVSDLKDAIETRKVVEKAKGILMKRSNLSEEDAFKMMQTHSQKENKKMREIADAIISASKLI
ncbi:MAG: response regulator [Deltaproteobacteria bacterium]|nr:response regulator [Deltaproteobacteria bacterium]